MKFWQLRKLLLPKGISLFIQNPRNKKKQSFRGILFQKMLLWSIQVHFWQPCQKSSRKLFFAVSTENINIWGYFKFSARKLIFWTRRNLVSQTFLLFHTKRFGTFCSKCKCKNDKSTLTKKTSFKKSPANTLNESFTTSLSLFYHKS